MTTAHRNSIAQRAITAIGSLPHHNVDSALEFSFKMGIPFLPQIPIRNPWEYMIAQALEGLPGLQVEQDGSVSLNVDIWASRASALGRLLGDAFAAAPENRAAFEPFEPSAAVSSGWQAFVWELEERGVKLAKVQIAGPMTSQWALRLRDGSSVGSVAGLSPATTDKHPDLTTQIYRLVLARALAMTRRLQALGIQPMIYLDEPGLYGLSLSNPKHVMGLQELKLMIHTLRKEGAWVGLHCCSNTNWDAILPLGINFLSIDTALSLESLLSQGRADRIEDFVSSGGRLSLGIIPTTRTSALRSLKVEELHSQLMERLREAWGPKPGLIRKVLSEAIFTPACGLAFHTVADAELVLETLSEFYDYSTGKLLEETSGTA